MYKHETKKPWKCDQCDFTHALEHVTSSSHVFTSSEYTNFFFEVLQSVFFVEKNREIGIPEQNSKSY